MIKYIRRKDTISGRLHNEMVMMDIAQGKYFSLNPVATTIWEFLEQPLTIKDICMKLMEEYEVDSTQCSNEVSEHITEMMKLGLILKE